MNKEIVSKIARLSSIDQEIKPLIKSAFGISDGLVDLLMGVWDFVGIDGHKELPLLCKHLLLSGNIVKWAVIGYIVGCIEMAIEGKERYCVENDYACIDISTQPVNRFLYLKLRSPIIDWTHEPIKADVFVDDYTIEVFKFTHSDGSQLVGGHSFNPKVLVYAKWRDEQ